MTNAELAEQLEAMRYAPRSIQSSKPEQDRAERYLEVMMRENAKQIIKALQGAEDRSVSDTPRMDKVFFHTPKSAYKVGCEMERELAAAVSHAHALGEQNNALTTECWDAKKALAGVLGLLVEARAEVLAQAEFHGCDNCNLTSMSVVERIDAVLAKERK